MTINDIFPLKAKLLPRSGEVWRSHPSQPLEFFVPLTADVVYIKNQDPTNKTALDKGFGKS